MGRPTIESAASSWIARRDAGLTAVEQAEFERWLSNPAHAQALARHEQTWKLFSGPHAAGRGTELMQEVRHRVIRRRRRRLILAATSACLLLVAGVMWNQYGGPEPATIAPISGSANAVVVRPERRVLPDGSVVDLRSGAAIRVDFDAGSTGPRRVALLKGEALFQVAKNKERPFVVLASGVEVRAVGTAFFVQMNSKQVDVIVTEGKVAVAAPTRVGVAKPETSVFDGNAGSTGHVQRLDGSGLLAAAAVSADASIVSAGEKISIDLARLDKIAFTSTSLPKEQIADALAWRSPRLEFTGTPLSEAVALMNRFNRVQLKVEDRTIARLEVSGYFRADNVDTFLHLIEESLGVHSERTGDTIILRADH